MEPLQLKMGNGFKEATGVYILENPPPQGGKNIGRCHLGKKYEKAKRKMGKCKRKRKKQERKRKKGERKRKGKENEKRGSKRVK
jgi:hypothetical protein